MTDKEKLISILNSQMESAEWKKETYKIEIKNNYNEVIISFNEFGFVFNKDTERFLGTFNWKW